MDATAVLNAIAAATERERILIAARRGEEHGMALEATTQLSALLDVTRELNAIGTQHALIGGVAVGIHSGMPRATVDVDVAIASSVDFARIIATLERAGFRLMGRHAHSINFRHPSGEPVQIAFDPEFDAMIERAETISVAGAGVRIVRKQDLIAMKQRAAADPTRRRSKAWRDRADIELLKGDVPEPDEGW